MAAKVFLHIGLPKTGTTYLQTVMWADRERMRAQGVLLPGRERRDRDHRGKGDANPRH